MVASGFGPLQGFERCAGCGLRFVRARGACVATLLTHTQPLLLRVHSQRIGVGAPFLRMPPGFSPPTSYATLNRTQTCVRVFIPRRADFIIKSTSISIFYSPTRDTKRATADCFHDLPGLAWCSTGMAPRIERSKAPHATLIPRILHRVASPDPRSEPLPIKRCEAPDRFSLSCRHHRERKSAA